jgi:hypothetical protein
MPERFYEGFGMEPSPFADKSDSREASRASTPHKSRSLDKLSRRDILKSLGVVAVADISNLLLVKGWDMFKSQDINPTRGMRERDFKDVKNFDQQVIFELYELLDNTLGSRKGSAIEMEKFTSILINPLQSGIEKIAPIIKKRFKETRAVSPGKLMERMSFGAVVGALTLPLAEKALQEVRKNPNIISQNETRRGFLTSLFATSGAVAGAAAGGIEQRIAVDKVAQNIVKSAGYSAALLLFDRLSADQPNYQPKEEDKERVERYEAVLRLAINPYNHFSDPKLLPSALERFGAAYYLLNFLEENQEAKIN